VASTRIDDCVPKLQELYPKLRLVYEQMFPGFSLKLTCTHRSPEEQFELFKKGRKETSDGRWVVDNRNEVVTYLDGKRILSRHNYYPSQAFDVAVITPSKELSWNESYYHQFPVIAEKLGLVNGGSWSTFKDWPHFQLPGPPKP
jgi:peptidoglycan L-alanyl-D-glutamate endopeptidase CwlK